MSWNFLCADMFPYEDSKTVSVCPYPEKRSHPSFVNISLTLVIETSMERSSRVLHHGNIKIWFFSRRFEIEFDLCWRAEINIQVGLTYMSTSGMHRRPFEGRHLVVLFSSAIGFACSTILCFIIRLSHTNNLPLFTGS